MPITIVGPKEVTLPGSMGGDDTMFGLTLVTATRGIFVEDFGSNQVAVKGLTDYSLLSKTKVGLLLSKGCDVFGYDAFFELTEEQLDEPVPASFPNRTVSTRDPQDPQAEPVVTVKTWAEWGDPATEIDGKWYKSNQDRDNLGIQLPASLWMNAGVPVLDPIEWRALRPNVML